MKRLNFPTYGLKSGLFFVLGITALAFYSFASRYFFHDTLSQDSRGLFGFFFNNFHSLNKFGEPGYWTPHINGGTPSFYYNVLGMMNASGPLSFLISAYAWISGLLSVEITKVHHIYLWYIGFIAPLAFNLSMWSLSKKIFKSEYTISYVLLLSAFSPGVILNYTHIGFLEQMAYAIFLTSSLVGFIQNGDKKSVQIQLVLSVALVALVFNYTSLFFTVPLIIFFIILTVFEKKVRDPLFTSFKSVKITWLILGVVAIGVCFLPFLTSKPYGEFLYRHVPGKLEYHWSRLQAGNAIEYLLVSTPGIIMDYLKEFNGFTLQQRGPAPNTAPYGFYIYQGILTLPLFAYALLSKKSFTTKVLFFLTLYFFGILIFGGLSPLNTILVGIVKPMTMNDHFFDMTSNTAFFPIVILCSALGFEKLVNSKDRKFLRYFSASVIFSVIVFIITYTTYKFVDVNFNIIYRFMINNNFGALLSFIFLFTILLNWLLDKDDHNVKNNIYALLFLVLIDVSTHGSWFVREGLLDNKTVSPEKVKLNLIHPSGVGLKGDGGTNTYLSLLLKTNNSYAADFIEMPYITVSRHVEAKIKATQEEIWSFSRKKKMTPIIINVNGLYAKDLDNDLTKLPKNKAQIHGLDAEETLQSKHFSYNEFKIESNLKRGAFLFLKDAYFKGWNASVNNQEVKIYRAFNNFKAIFVPAGKNNIRFWYKPPFVTASIVLGNLIILILISLFIYFRRKEIAAPENNP